MEGTHPSTPSLFSVQAFQNLHIEGIEGIVLLEGRGVVGWEEIK
jgi:hypothetical protein